MDNKALAKQWLAEKYWVIDDILYMSNKLMFHYSLLIDVSEHTYEQRYCYKDLALLTKAVEEFKTTGQLRYWHKDHTKGISVKGKYLYTQGMLQEPEYSMGEVDWVVE